MLILNMKHDVTKQEDISMIVCEMGKIPAASVPIVIRELKKEEESRQDERKNRIKKKTLRRN